MIEKFNHLGVAVKNLEEAIKFFQEKYGARLVWRSKFEDQGVESAFLAIGDAQFELSGSIRENSAMSKFIETKGEGIHHISLEVKGFDEVIKGLKAKGLKVIAEADTKDFKAAFIHPGSNFGILTEIIEPKPDGIMAPEKKD
jgi:methylmalonyl-CoA/ethylmalonyl-CoA epimerase